MPAGLRAKVLREFDQISQLAREWDDLFQRCPGATTFQRPEWLVAWLRWWRYGENRFWWASHRC